MLEEQIKKTEQNLLDQAVTNYKKTGKNPYRLLKLLKTDIKRMKELGKKPKEILNLLNLTLKTKIPYNTFRNFYYQVQNKKQRSKKQNLEVNKKVVSDESDKKNASGIFDNLK